MQPRDLKVGDVVQLDPEKVQPAFAGCFMLVTEPKNWGAQGFVQGMGETQMKQGGAYFFRAKWEQMEFVGRAVFVPKNHAEEADAD